MKRLIIPLIAFLVISACNQENKGTANLRNEQPEMIDTLCFVRLDGLQNQDTTSLRLVINGENVTGQFASFPDQKDARIGTINGTKTGNLIKGMWRYQQEGIVDSIGFEFKLQGDKLLQKQSNFDTNTGRESLSDTSAFSIEFLKQDCRSADPRIIKTY